MDKMLRIREINDYDEALELQEQWNEVLDRSRDKNIFLTWEWLSTWWRHYGKKRRLVILLAHEGERIAAIAPLMHSVYRLSGLRLRKIEFFAEHIDYRNFILAEKKAECLRLFLRHLNTLDWDSLEFRDIPESAESLTLLRKIYGNEHTLNELVSSKCPHLPLPASWNVLAKHLSGNMRRNLRRRMKRLKENCTVAFTRQDEIDSLRQDMKTFFSLHQKRWASKGLRGSFGRDPKFREFLLDVARCFAEKKWLNLSFLTANDEPISAALCFEYNKVLYYYHPGFDPEYAKYGVGNLLIMCLMQDAIQRDLNEFDFLKGDEAYKNDWTSLSWTNFEVRYVRNRLLPMLYDRVTRSAEFDWLKRSNNSLLRKLKDVARESIR
jgi:CelD/BcsL family acetyltransferase involved in cellulose biosynthesis